MADNNNTNDSYYKQLSIELPNGTHCTVVVDQPTYVAAVINNDQGVLQEIMNNVTDNPAVCKQVALEQPNSETAKEPTKAPVLDKLKKTDSRFQWTTDDALALIESYRCLKNKFESSCIRKKEAWTMVAENLQAKGIAVTGTSCDEKWRSLKHRYQVIRDNKKKSGMGRRKWDLYEKMDDMLGNDPAVEPVTLITARAITQRSTSPPINSDNFLPDTEPVLVNSDTEPEGGCQSNEPRKKKKVARKPRPNAVGLIQELQVSLTTQMDAVMEQQRQANNIQQERNELLAEFNACLKKHLHHEH